MAFCFYYLFLIFNLFDDLKNLSVTNIQNKYFFSQTGQCASFSPLSSDLHVLTFFDCDRK